MAAPTPSGVRFHLKINMLDGTTHDVHTIPFDAIRWERNSGKPFGESSGSAEMLAFLAYAAAHRLKLTTEQKLDGFAAQVEEIYILEDESDSDPTPADTQPAESLS